jgi:hypothetical protein
MPNSTMPEAETSLRLAFFLLENSLTQEVTVGIDGAQVKTGERVVFPIEEFLVQERCECVDPSSDWRGAYRHRTSGGRVIIHSKSGEGDVVCEIRNGRTFRAECKKGPLIRKRSSPEYPLLREAIGQLLTLEAVEKNDLLAAVVPHSVKFAELADRWRQAPLMRRAGIQILTVARDNVAHGLELS